MCHRTLPLAEFYVDRTRADGRGSRCKACDDARDRSAHDARKSQRRRAPEPAVASAKRALINEAAVRRDLAELPGELAERALAAAALTLARELDDPETSASAKSMCAGRLLETMRELRALIPKPRTKDAIDFIADARAARLAALPARRA
jgi:hypothetical protein